MYNMQNPESEFVLALSSYERLLVHALSAYNCLNSYSMLSCFSFFLSLSFLVIHLSDQLSLLFVSFFRSLNNIIQDATAF